MSLPPLTSLLESEVLPWFDNRKKELAKEPTRDECAGRIHTNSVGHTMNIQPAKRAAHSASADRMRLYRKRRREGLQVVRVPLHVTDIDDLIQVGRLGEDQRHD